MFIQTEQTPNPASLKFLPGCEVLRQGTADFTSAENAVSSPLAQRLFNIKGIAGVFLGSDFITVTKTDETSWDGLKTDIMGALMEHFSTGQPVMTEDIAPATHDISDDDSDIVRTIKEILDTRIRPAVAADGGDITFHNFDEKSGVVLLEMRGACAGCPSSTATLKTGIENLLKHFIPEVVEVQAVNA